MEWLNKAAQGFREANENEKEFQEIQSRVKKEYPEMVNRLWGMFQTTFAEVEKNFGEKMGFEVTGDKMRIVIGDVMITGTATNVEKMGGFYGTAHLDYEAIHTHGGPKLPISDLLLYLIDTKPVWVYRDVRNGKHQNIPFEQSDVEKLFETALWKYLR